MFKKKKKLRNTLIFSVSFAATNRVTTECTDNVHIDSFEHYTNLTVSLHFCILISCDSTVFFKIQKLPTN
uniref:Uncharacterized protein n=1 Tax=Wuchereria bancrofti TaxID=6293 RepID=A0A1I8F0S4_WUCBA